MTDYHNKGQTDASNGVDRAPHDLGSRIIDILFLSPKSETEYQQDIEDYNVGHSHTESQTKRK